MVVVMVYRETLLTCRSFHSCSCSDSLGLSGSLNTPSVSMETGSYGPGSGGGWWRFSGSLDSCTLLMR